MKYRILRLLFTITWIAVIFHPTEVGAEIYSFTDENGVLHFSNVPTSSKYRFYSHEENDVPYFHETGIHLNRYDSIIRHAAGVHDVPFELVKAVIRVESNFNPTAVSSAGALGLMQIMPENLSEFNISDPFDPWENIMGGARYLRYLMEKFDSDLELCLAAYNAGPTAVERYRSVPPYPETENYVHKVMKYCEYYRNELL